MHPNYDPPPLGTLELVYIDDFLLVLNKPSGLLSVPGRGANKSDCLTMRVQQVFPDALSVHRLDMSTSGLMVIARGKVMQSRLSRMFREHRAKKLYIAMLAGRVKTPTGAVDLPLAPDWPNRPRQQIDVAYGKSSFTRYRLLAYDEAADTSRVELEPLTSRTHQLRVHMAAIGHPIMGDRLYGAGSGANARRLLLHASGLSFNHPESAQAINLVCEPPF
jgi:tRNA pseudouridine32 synthase / 23S rRNA pseudouridine746 synthase